MRAAHLRAHYTAVAKVVPAVSLPEEEIYAGATAGADEPTMVLDTEIVSLPRKGKRILTPSVAQIQTYANDAIELQGSLRMLASEVDQFIRDRPQDNR